MSFGWSAGDVAAGLQLAFKIADALRASGGSVEQRDKAQSFLQTYQQAIYLVNECYVENEYDAVGNVVKGDPQLGSAMDSLKSLHKRLEKRLNKYVKLEKQPDEDPVDWIARQVQKLAWAFFAQEKVQEIRAQIIGQIQVIQPILLRRQGDQTRTVLDTQHGENRMNFEIVKDQNRILQALSTEQFEVLHNLLLSLATKQTATDGTPLPITGPDAGIAAMPNEPAFEGYVDARTKISPYVPRPMPDDVSAALKKLKSDNKLIQILRNWLLDSDSDANHNILWLLSPSALKLSAIVYSASREASHPVLAYSCRQLDDAGADIPTRTTFTQMLYSFLDALLGSLQQSKDAKQRIDASLFQALDGTFATAASAITLTGNLLDNLPTACVCVIDNFQRLDVVGDPQVKSLVKDFLGLFKVDAGRAGANYQGRHKLLLTTKGLTEMLVDMGANGEVERCKTDDRIDKGRYAVWEEMRTAVKAGK